MLDVMILQTVQVRLTELFQILPPPTGAPILPTTPATPTTSTTRKTSSSSRSPALSPSNSPSFGPTLTSVTPADEPQISPGGPPVASPDESPSVAAPSKRGSTSSADTKAPRRSPDLGLHVPPSSPRAVLRLQRLTRKNLDILMPAASTYIQVLQELRLTDELDTFVAAYACLMDPDSRYFSSAVSVAYLEALVGQQRWREAEQLAARCLSSMSPAQRSSALGQSLSRWLIMILLKLATVNTHYRYHLIRYFATPEQLKQLLVPPDPDWAPSPGTELVLHNPKYESKLQTHFGQLATELTTSPVLFYASIVVMAILFILILWYDIRV